MSSAAADAATGAGSMGWVVEEYKKHDSALRAKWSPDDEDLDSPVVASLRVLTRVIRDSTASTLMGLQREVAAAIALLKANAPSMSVASACELFSRFVVRTSADFPDFAQCKKVLAERGDRFIDNSRAAKHVIAENADPFIRDGDRIMTLSYSRVVVAALVRAARRGKRFSVLALESRPDQSGRATAQALAAAGVPVTLTVDGAAAHFSGRVDSVFCGAEAIVESGGILNKIGTYGLALACQALGVPFYVAGESFKFTRAFPLGQGDFAQKAQDPARLPAELQKAEEGVDLALPGVDYTPPEHITFLITELGILTPSAVSDQLIVLYR